MRAIIFTVVLLLLLSNIARAHAVKADEEGFTKHIHPFGQSTDIKQCRKTYWCDLNDGHKPVCGLWIDPLKAEDGVIQLDDPSNIKGDTEDWPWELDDYDPLHQKVAQLEREIQILGVQLGSVREELFWLRSINRELIKEIYKRNHL